MWNRQGERLEAQWAASAAAALLQPTWIYCVLPLLMIYVECHDSLNTTVKACLRNVESLG